VAICLCSRHRELILRGDPPLSLWAIKTLDCHAPHLPVD